MMRLLLHWIPLVCILLWAHRCSSFLVVQELPLSPRTTTRWDGMLPHHGIGHSRHTPLYQLQHHPKSSQEPTAAETDVDVVATQESSSSSSSKTERLSLVRPQTIAVVGSGAIGCYYGGRLWEAGHQVKFFMRGDHYSASTTQGLNISSIDGDMFIDPEVLEAYESTHDMGPVDWVIVAFKSSAMEAIPDLVYPLLSPETRVLVIMNGLIEEDLLRMMKERAGETSDLQVPLQCCKAWYGGMAFVCSNRLGPGRVHHSYAGQLTGGVASTTSSSSSDDDDDDDDRKAFEELWRHAKVPIVYDSCLLRGRWKKNLWNLPFNGLSTAMGGWTVDRIVTDPSLRRLAEFIMDETIAIANADLERKHGKGNFDPLVPAEKIPMMTLTDHMGPYKTSTMLDLTNRRPMEVKYLFQVPVERARKLGVRASHLETVVAQIEALQRLYGL